MINKNNFKKINELLDSIFNELAEIKRLFIMYTKGWTRKLQNHREF